MNWRKESFDNSNFSRDQFQSCIFVPFPTIIVDSNPRHHIHLLFFLVKHKSIICFPAESSCSIGNLAVSGHGFSAEDFPVEGGFSEETFWQFSKLNGFDLVVDCDSFAGLDDVTFVETKKNTCNSDTPLSQLDPSVNFFIYVLFHDLLRVYQVGFILLEKYCEIFRWWNSFEGDCLSLDVGGHICEVEIAYSLVEGYGAGVLDHGKFIIVDRNCKIYRFANEGTLCNDYDEEKRKQDVDWCFHYWYDKSSILLI